MDEQTLFVTVAVIGSLAGWLVSITFPFARKYFAGEVEQFEWRKVALRALFGFGAVLGTLTSASGLSQIQELADQQWVGLGLAIVYGFVTLGASSLGHQVQSSPKAIKEWRNGKDKQ